MTYAENDKRRWKITLFVILIGSIFVSCGVYINGFIGDLFRLMTSLNISYWVTYPGWKINQTWLNRNFPHGTLLRMLLLNAILYVIAITSDTLFHTRLTTLVVIQYVTPYLLAQFISFSIADLLQRYGERIQAYLQ